jgi:glutamate synthase domain-containing protein 3
VIRSPNGDRGGQLDNPVMMGNAVMYGATGGSLFVAGQAGERFCVRNSGGWAVVEGCGDHGCEYMTNGIVAVLGGTGRNFGAGMTGGVAYVLDEEGLLATRIHEPSIQLEPLTDELDEGLLRALLERHFALTASRCAAGVLDYWDSAQATIRVASPINDSITWRANMRVMKEQALEKLQGIGAVNRAS